LGLGGDAFDAGIEQLLAISRDFVGALGVVELLLGSDFVLEEALGALEIAAGGTEFGVGGFDASAGLGSDGGLEVGFFGVAAGFGFADLGFEVFFVQLSENLALCDRVPLVDQQRFDNTVSLGFDADAGERLDFSASNDG